MSDFLVQDRLVHDRRAAGAGDVPSGRVHVPPATGERRRPGRMETADPALIALMRKPDRAARLRVALYDAPGFVLPAQGKGRPAPGPGWVRLAVAAGGCLGGCAVAFRAMLLVWG